MSNNEIIDTIVAGVNGILDKRKRLRKILQVRKFINNADCLTKRDRQAIWDKVGKKL